MVIERKPSAANETIAEGIQACLALIAVVLLARAQSGAFVGSPSAWVVLPISILIWAASAVAMYWSPPSRQPWFAAWRSCVSPTLITLMIGGRGSVPLLLSELVLIAVGTIAVVCIAFRASLEIAVTADAPAPVSSEIHTSVAGKPAAPVELVAPDPISTAQISPSCQPTPDLASPEADHLEASRIVQRLDPAHDGVSLHRGTSGEEDEESHASGESAETESWTRREYEGEVSIEAVVLARFEAGARLAVLHLPFVPPLPELPQIEYEPLDSGCDVSITTESAYRHGARLNVTRRTAGPAESVPIGIVIYTSVEEEIES